MERDDRGSTGLRLLALYAHPDDEVFTAGGTIALAATRGIDVTLAVATGGEQGEIVNPEMRDVVTLEQLPAVRQQELARSAATLGIARTIGLGYRDSGMAGTASSTNGAAFSQQARNTVVRRVTQLMREVRPHVVITEPEDGGYGHPDHIALHAATVQAFERAGDPTWHPEDGDAWSPARLYFGTWSQSLFQKLRDGYAAHGQEFRFGTGMVIIDDGTVQGRSDEDITTVVDISTTIHRKIEAMHCHQTQIMKDFFYFTAPDDVLNTVLNAEYFVLGASHVPSAGVEHDLFAGISP